jgi:hypothetical protein
LSVPHFPHNALQSPAQIYSLNAAHCPL